MVNELTFTGREAIRLEEIAKYYTVTKEILIFAEQVDPQNRTLPQVINELRNCLDHLMRVVSFKLGLREVEGGDDYIEINLNKAYGHVYRAAYDTLDWLSLTLKDRIVGEMQEFSLETIHNVMPEYFTEIRPRMEQILGDEIASLRIEKDVAAKSEQNLIKYGQVTADLKQLFQKVINRKSALVEHDIRVKRSRRRRLFLSIAIKVLVGVVVGVLVWLLT